MSVARGSLGVVMLVHDALRRAGLCASGGEARRLIKQGGGRVNDVQAADEERPVTATDLNADGLIKLSAGKKKHALLRAV